MSNNFEKLISVESLRVYLLPIDKLQNDTLAIWGKMGAQHMVEHLIYSLQMGNGKLKVNCLSPVDKLPVLKRILLSNRPLPRNFINPIIGDELLPLQYHSLENAKSELAIEIDDCYQYFEEHPDSKPINPTFGNLNKEEWLIFHHKHFTHHLAQFGLIPG